ncbi:unnamed protein product [Vitrella brassicaformis CCMP3155]|uniref:Uncharacterized protein n=1 Tax=Vitrella brassicaformis (strain CCMP3155) TaxID=1169540 RepID=A0A0G4FNI3_VITBC|nr:unnamed protein product [Vitrella brassicaformis CCMP3155]|eukprot:CEM15781.1 unnamed protein product [Vitrella brassicaformis CCMP3155]
MGAYIRARDDKRGQCEDAASIAAKAGVMVVADGVGGFADMKDGGVSARGMAVSVLLSGAAGAIYWLPKPLSLDCKKTYANLCFARAVAVNTMDEAMATPPPQDAHTNRAKQLLEAGWAKTAADRHGPPGARTIAVAATTHNEEGRLCMDLADKGYTTVDQKIRSAPLTVPPPSWPRWSPCSTPTSPTTPYSCSASPAAGPPPSGPPTS